MENNELKEQLFGSAAGGVYTRIQSYRDNGTQADEFLRIGWALMALSMFFTIGYGCVFHYNLTLPYLGDTGAKIFAVAFTAFIEVGKFYTGRWALRNLFFGIFKQGVPSFAIMVFGLAISTGTFAWSYWNSTKGVAYITGYLAETKIERQTVDVNGALAPVDARQTQIKQLADRGLGITWKGKVTRSGQRIAERAAAANLEAEKQRTLLLEQGTKEQARLDTHRDTFIGKIATMLAMLGGKMEYLQIILLLGIVAAERTLYDRMKQKAPPKTQNPDYGGSDSFRAHRMPPPYEASNTKNGYSNAAKNGPIGFNVNHETGNVHSTINGLPKTEPQNPSPDVCHNVPHSNAEDWHISADAVLKNAKTRLSREVANLKNTNGDPRSVARRMHSEIDQVGHILTAKGFKPAEKLATDFYVYMDTTVFEVLNQHRRPYEFEEPFLKDLRQHCNEAELHAQEHQFEA